MNTRTAMCVVCAIMAGMTLSASASISLGGITFDDNAFADDVIYYTPGISFERQITDPFDRVATTAEDAVLGSDLASSTIEMSSDQILAVQFTDNAVINLPGDDIAIFELFSIAEFGEATILATTMAVNGVSLGSIAIPGTSFSNYVNLATIDLSDFGVAPNAVISSIQMTVSGVGSEYAAFGAINNIPEPATFGLIGIAATGVIFVRRRFLM